jgi:uncharacterized protein YjbI with pentapeptide repeats
MKLSLLTLLCTLGLATLSLADDKDFHDQDLKAKDFKSQSLNGANFADAILRNAAFDHSTLKKANFKGADLWQVSFSAADLTGADLRGASTREITFSETTLNEANMEGCEIPAAWRAKFRGANLQKCKFTGSIITCDFSGADLRGANLRGAHLDPDNRWKNAVYDDDTAWPDGFDPKAAGAVLATADDKKATDAAK